MKRLSPRQRKRQIYLSTTRFDRRRRRQLRWKTVRMQQLFGIPPRATQKSEHEPGFFDAPKTARAVTPPRNFNFGEDAEELLSWLGVAFRQSNKQIDRFHKNNKKVPRRLRILSYHDFTKIETITPAAALVLAAFFDRHHQLAGVPIRVYDYDKWNPSVRQVLDQVGFFDLLEVHPELAEHPPSSQAAKIERFTSERKLQPDELGRLVDRLLSYILAAHPESLSTDELTVRTAKLFGALVEATENTRRHAYPADTHSGYRVLPNWWLTGFVDPAERHLTLIVYDQGISMPGSLASARASTWPGHEWVNRIVARFSRGTFDTDDPISDHAKIRLAMKLGQSSTGLPHRGKGLPVVREAINHCVRGRLHILSRNGAYLEETGRKAESWQLTSPMPGTLIVWDLWL